MKYFLQLILGVLLFNLTGCSTQTGQHGEVSSLLSARFDSLLKQKCFFELRREFSLKGEQLSTNRHLYFSSILDNAFNRNTSAVKTIDTLLNQYPTELQDSTKLSLILLQGDSYFKLFRYADAARASKNALDRYSSLMDSSKISDIQNDVLIRNALKAVLPQEIRRKDSALIDWKRDQIGLIEIPVHTPSGTFSGIFDTRANLSSITTSYARKLGLRMLDVSYEGVSGITGIRFKTGLGIADSLYIGNRLICNVVFQVMPDSVLYIEPLHFSINLIIGYPVIEQLEEIHIFKDGRMFLPSQPAKSALHNFAIDVLDPVVALQKGEETSSFYFDLGANTTTLYKAYFEKYKKEVQSQSELKSVRYGGAGGVQEKEVYVMGKIKFFLGHQPIVLDSVNILTKKIFPEEVLYGNLGQDFVSSFDELIINFKYMYIDGRRK